MRYVFHKAHAQGRRRGRPRSRAGLRKARRPERATNAAARRELVRALGPLWQNVADGVRVGIDEHRLVAQLTSGAADLDVILGELDRSTAALLATAFRDAIEAGSRIGARHSGVLGNLEINREALDARILGWIETQGGRRITRITAQNRQAVRGIVADVLRDGVTPERAALDIGRMIGLNRGQARALRNYELNLIRRRIPQVAGGPAIRPDPRASALTANLADTQFVREAIAQDVERYRDRLLRQRGNTIIETEAQAGIQAGERLFWQQLAEDHPRDVELGQTTKTWFTVLDDRVCEICEPLHGVAVGFQDVFPGEGGDGPPAHPRCRCYLDFSHEGGEGGGRDVAELEDTTPGPAEIL